MTAERVRLEAGPLSAIWEEGGLRRIRWGGLEIARGIYCAVRDRNWGTVPAAISDLSVRTDDRRFVVTFRAVHREAEISFRWDGKIEGDASGRLEFGMAGEADGDFERNRIGFCVLHPMEHAGIPLIAGTDEGEVRTEFPIEISPRQPLTGIRSLAFEPGPGVQAKISFKGESFEMEDQRNWTDASYKTYCTPLALPFPVKVRKGERVRQRVSLRVSGTPTRDRDSSDGGQPLRLTPVAGTLPDIGLTLAKPIRRLSEEEAHALRELSISHFHAETDLEARDWEERLEHALANGERIGAGLVIEAIAGSDCDETVARLAGRLARETERGVTLYVFDRRTHVTHPEGLAKALAEREKLNAPYRIGGGARAHFAELNRTRLPIDRLDEVGYAVCPQVHAFDSESIFETLGAQTGTAINALRLSEGKPVRVGPITFKQRFNAVATNREADASLDAYDPRQHTMLGAVWLLGSLSALTAGGASGATYFSTTGKLGVIAAGAVRFTPAFHLLRSLAPFKSAKVFRAEGGPPGLIALALSRGNRMRLWLGNATQGVLETTLELPPSARRKSFRMMDDATLARDAEAGFADFDSHVETKLCLPPYAIAMVEWVQSDE